MLSNSLEYFVLPLEVFFQTSQHNMGREAQHRALAQYRHQCKMQGKKFVNKAKGCAAKKTHPKHRGATFASLQKKGSCKSGMAYASGKCIGQAKVESLAKKQLAAARIGRQMGRGAKRFANVQMQGVRKGGRRK